MNITSPLISVILSVKNNESTITYACNSILNQTYKNLELLIIDDFSEDSTLEKLKKISKNDKRVKLHVNTKNIGLTKSLNKLVKLSRGELIARQDADDESYPNRIFEQLKYLTLHNLDAVTSRAQIMNTKKIIPGLSYYLPHSISMKFKNPFIHGTLLIKKKVIEEIGLYDERFYYSQDFKLFIDLISSGYKVKNMNKVLYKLNMDNNISKSFKEEQKYYFNAALEGYDPSKTRN